MKLFGLIGKTLHYSFSKNYFTEKYQKENIPNCEYELFELEQINEFPKLLAQHTGTLSGLNVTIPYKLEVMQYLDEIDSHAAAIQAVNTIKFMPDGKLKGYNTDYYGFKSSIEDWDLKGKKALVLGTGGASKAIKKALEDLNIPYLMVSRTASTDCISYDQLSETPETLKEHHLIINTTPLGTYPDVSDKANLPYQSLTPEHRLFDLVYNPETTAFMQEGLNAGALVKNGYKMLVGQAEKAWEIWNQ
ncbi:MULTISPECIES: shikimate dehydrogenase [Reichenbachiella]|uniref:Shikimate dehydrogenase n=1 Tax=Reichenbachiella agariperforans TaxID=156994 RepID=A0A1M6JY23_REIAG|nr:MULTISPECIES: shikimate dehydrogenase [Reichenbachiella]RJE74668.1 shikimate dehydrogenase [Reichenbachiella sp. MSK19-1]SHJ51594.1 shikimate dehydrogenase [Reichenbachiella agariperforans]